MVTAFAAAARGLQPPKSDRSRTLRLIAGSTIDLSSAAKLATIRPSPL
jgi:hypothetical protein